MAKLRPKQIATETANPGDVLTWNGTDWAPAAGGGGSVPPLFYTLFVDQNTAVAGPSQDGSIGKPFSTIQAAIDSLGAPTELHAHLMVVYGAYTENVNFPGVLISSLSITGIGLGFGPGGTHTVRINGTVTVDGAEAGNTIFLENCELDTAVSQKLYLSKSNIFGTGTSTPTYVVLADDVSQAIPGAFTNDPVVWAPDHDVSYTSLNGDSSGDVTLNRVVASLYLVGVYVYVSSPAVAGTMDVNLVFVDPNFTQTLKIGTVDLTTSGPTTLTAAVFLSDGKITWTTVTAGLSGTPTYHLYFGAHMTGRGNPI